MMSLETNHGIPSGRYAVIGGSGLIGSHLLDRLADRTGIDVVAISHTRQPKIVGKNIQSHIADAREPDSLAPILDGVDYVIICAGILTTAPVLDADPVKPVLENLRIGVGILEAIFRACCRQCVLISSTTGYPPGPGQLKEDQLLDDNPPDRWYGIGWVTRFLETQCRWYAEKIPCNNTTFAILRPTMVYGEYDNFDEKSAHFLPSMIRRAVHRESPIEVWGKGDQARDIVYAGDVADAALSALNLDKPISIYNVGSGKLTTVRECLDLILSIDGFMDAEIIQRHDKPVSPPGLQVSVDKAVNDLALGCLTSLPDGLTRTINWYRDSIDMHGVTS